MASLNKCCFIGNLGSDPEVRQVGESKVANFSIAVTEKYKDKSGQQQSNTEWISVVFWNRQAEIVEQYLRKGSSVYIEGKFSTRSWDDKTTGDKKYKTEIKGIVLQMLGGRQESSGGGGVSASQPAPTPASGDSSQGFQPADDQELPF
jgi:single-strand DNA-binding protein